MNYWLNKNKKSSASVLEQFFFEFRELSNAGILDFKDLYKKYPSIRIGCRRAFFIISKMTHEEIQKRISDVVKERHGVKWHI